MCLIKTWTKKKLINNEKTKEINRNMQHFATPINLEFQRPFWLKEKNVKAIQKSPFEIILEIYYFIFLTI